MNVGQLKEACEAYIKDNPGNENAEVLLYNLPRNLPVMDSIEHFYKLSNGDFLLTSDDKPSATEEA